MPVLEVDFTNSWEKKKNVTIGKLKWNYINPIIQKQTQGTI